MSVVRVDKDPVALTMAVTAEFTAPVGKVWDVWADPRKLERWWGPPTHPATFVDHDLSPGGRVSYYMTGPKGEKYHGWWRVVSSTPPRELDFEDGFADDQGEPVDAMPTMTVRVRLSNDGTGKTTMVITSQFASPEGMQQVLEMGAEEGLVAALNQIDGLLADTVEA